jgi:hypothetical protein
LKGHPTKNEQNKLLAAYFTYQLTTPDGIMLFKKAK